MKVSRLLGKGGFGVVNLAVYRGQQTAMKQLLTITPDSVKRFRFECFLMKNLRHPNIVKLVGVCWDDSLFACCLEFVENGSLEDWLRRTAGGQFYDPSKKKKGRQDEPKDEIPLAEAVFKGYDHDGKFDESLHTSSDKEQLEIALTTIERFRTECEGGTEQPQPAVYEGKWAAAAANTKAQEKNEGINRGTGRGTGREKSGWQPLCQPDKSPLAHNALGCWRLNGKVAEAFAIIEVSASPAQVFGFYLDLRRDTSEAALKNETIDHNGTIELNFVKIPAVLPGMHDRESLARGVVKKLEDGGLIEMHYQVEDERRPVASGAKRIFSEYAMMARETERGGGKVTELMCLARIDLRLSMVAASMLGGIAGRQSVAATAEPIIKMKLDVERLLGEYEPVLEENKEGIQSLSWKGQLLNIAIQCALGVQYLHQEQYWAEEEAQEDGRVVAAGYRQCIIHR